MSLYYRAKIVYLLLSNLPWILFAAFRDLWSYATSKRADVRDQVAVITGAGAGLGRRMAAGLALEHGALVVLCDRDQEALEEAADDIRSRGGRVLSEHVDVTRPEQLRRVAAMLHGGTKDGLFGTDTGESGPCAADIVVCNAGVLNTGWFCEEEAGSFARLIDVNVTGTLNTIHAFLPYMLRRGSGHIVAMCSVGSHAAAPTGLAYTASKFAVRGAMAALEAQLRALGYAGRIRLTSVYPFFTRTGMIDGIEPHSNALPVLEPADVAEAAVDAVLRRRNHVHIPDYGKGLFVPSAFMTRRVTYAMEDALDTGYGVAPPEEHRCMQRAQAAVDSHTS